MSHRANPQKQPLHHRLVRSPIFHVIRYAWTEIPHIVRLSPERYRYEMAWSALLDVSVVRPNRHHGDVFSPLLFHLPDLLVSNPS